MEIRRYTEADEAALFDMLHTSKNRGTVARV
jgi:hypothetical protein